MSQDFEPEPPPVQIRRSGPPPIPRLPPPPPRPTNSRGFPVWLIVIIAAGIPAIVVVCLGGFVASKALRRPSFSNAKDFAKYLQAEVFPESDYGGYGPVPMAEERMTAFFTVQDDGTYKREAKARQNKFEKELDANSKTKSSEKQIRIDLAAKFDKIFRSNSERRIYVTECQTSWEIEHLVSKLDGYGPYAAFHSGSFVIWGDSRQVAKAREFLR